MFKPTSEQLKKVLLQKHYAFNTGEWQINIIGIRNDSSQPNSFDDTLCVWFTDHYGEDVVAYFSCTTDAGLYWLKHPTCIEGCAIMKEGYYPNVYKIGLHRGYKALEQIGKMRYVRDNNKDATLNFDANDEIFANIKTNIHHASLPENSTLVDKWSAGCQVINKGWFDFLELCEHSALITGKKQFSYTLLNKKDFVSV